MPFEAPLGDLSEQRLTVRLAMVDETRAIRGHGSKRVLAFQDGQRVST